MSETNSSIILFNEDANSIKKLHHLFDSSETGLVKSKFGDYSIENAMLFDNAIISYISAGSSFDTVGFLKELSADDPDWLYVENEHDQIGEWTTTCLKKGNKKSTKKTLLKIIRLLSKQVDLYYAAINQEKDQLARLLEHDGINLDMQVDGAPLLFLAINNSRLEILKHLMENGLPPYLMRSLGCFAYESAYGKMASYLKQQMKDFFTESKKRIKIARVLYNHFTAKFELVELKKDKAIGQKDLSSLDEFSDHCFMQNLHRGTIEWLAEISANTNKKVLKTKVDDEFNVTFSRTKHTQGDFVTIISTNSEAEIINISNEI